MMRKKKISSFVTCILSSALMSLFFSQPGALSSTTETSNGNKQRNLYGSIAVYGYGSRAGYSWNYPSRQEAIDAALKSCFQSSRGKCRTAISFRNGCGALARAIGSYGTGYGTDELTAQYEALRNCKSKFCRIKKVVCNSTK